METNESGKVTCFCHFSKSKGKSKTLFSKLKKTQHFPHLLLEQSGIKTFGRKKM
jgi:hypothetical protein